MGVRDRDGHRGIRRGHETEDVGRLPTDPGRHMELPLLVEPRAPERGPLKGMPTRLSAVARRGGCTGRQRDRAGKQQRGAKPVL